MKQTLTCHSYGGKDVASILQDEVSHQHSEATYEILDEYQIGFLPSTHIPAGATGQLPPSPPRTPNNLTSTGMDSEEELHIPTDIVNDYKQNKFLDLNRPLFMQVFNGGFSRDFYLEQVHKPRHYKGGESAPLFGNFLEPLTKTPWWIIPTVWLPWVTYGTWTAAKGLSPVESVSFFGLGLAIWTLVEYIMHRCLFHLDE